MLLGPCDILVEYLRLANIRWHHEDTVLVGRLASSLYFTTFLIIAWQTGHSMPAGLPRELAITGLPILGLVVQLVFFAVAQRSMAQLSALRQIVEWYERQLARHIAAQTNFAPAQSPMHLLILMSIDGSLPPVGTRILRSDDARLGWSARYFHPTKLVVFGTTAGSAGLWILALAVAVAGWHGSSSNELVVFAGAIAVGALIFAVVASRREVPATAAQVSVSISDWPVPSGSTTVAPSVPE